MESVTPPAWISFLARRYQLATPRCAAVFIHESNAAKGVRS